MRRPKFPTKIRTITKEQYQRACRNKMRLTDEDFVEVFDEHEIKGYGIEDHFVQRKQGEYFVIYKEGTVCSEDWR